MKCKRCGAEMKDLGERTVYVHFDSPARTYREWSCPSCRFGLEEMVR